MAIAIVALCSASMPGAAQSPKDDPPPLSLDYKPFWRMQRYADIVSRIQSARQVDPTKWEPRMAAELGRFDLQAYAETARLYSQILGPQYRAYLASLKTLDTSFRAGISTARNAVEIAGKTPGDPAAWEAATKALGSLETRLKLPAQTADLLEVIKRYEAAMRFHAGEQFAMYQKRSKQRLRREPFDREEESFERHQRRLDQDRRQEEENNPGSGVFIPGTNFPMDSGERMRRMHPGSPRNPEDAGSPIPPNGHRIIYPLPTTRILEQESAAFQELQNYNEFAMTALPALKTCVAATGRMENDVRRALRTAIASKGRYTDVKGALNELERGWRWLISYVGTCSDQRLWEDVKDPWRH